MVIIRKNCIFNMNFLNQINSDPRLLYVFIRAILIYLYTIFLFRMGNSRFNFKTPFDLALIFILGSVLSRGINGTSTLIHTLFSSLPLVLLHALFAKLAFYSHSFGKLIKGKPVPLIQNGHICFEALKHKKLSQEDLIVAVRTQLGEKDLNLIEEAYLERTGNISFIKKSNQ